jgi:membrane protein YdbS with pleckstrin-like domain
MENFSNSVLLPENLPVIEKEIFNTLDKKYLRIQLIRKSVFTIIVIGGMLAFQIFSKAEIPVFVKISVSGIIVLLLLYSLLLVFWTFPRKGYLLRENDISFQKGLFFYKITSVPFNRIQHVEVSQGILAKAFKISTLKLFTAGGSGSDLSIPGLPEDVAQNLKTFLSDKISHHE